MSSPNHPTSNIEDAFSSNFPDYLLASLDYVPASPRKTYSSSSNSFGLVPIASPTLLFFFHDDPYMKVLQAFYTKKSPIPPPIITPPSSIPNPSEFFLLEEFSSPKKQDHDQSSSSTYTLPQAFEIRESSHKTSLERHKEKIKGILNHLDELYLDRIELIEDKIEGLRQESKWEVTIRLLLLALEFPISNKSLKNSKLVTKMSPKRTSTYEAPTMTQAAIRKLVVDSVATALETQAATMENADNANRNPEPREAPVARKCSYKEFMSCQPFKFKGSEGVIGLIYWFERTKLVFSCSNCTEDCKIQKMEDEFYHLTVKGNDLKTYVRRFQELATLCLTMVLDSEKLLEAFIGGLP
uniref:Reverse transcriptase domain-containing protein n=1 Tax=Tanacetum cinerariifolium TaxID=118510 RepID=A0A6L2LIV2_TANCI|nr:reverse transcriptase domain-containing protein [Tanacetum cinerariifolium]